MPFTPLHLGIGTICKATSKHQFSFMIFGGAQILMDLEPLLGMLLGWSHLHLYTHNLFGAISIGLIAMLLGKPISEWLLKKLNYQYWQISWKVTISSALVATISHVGLDAFMHFDMYPLYPLSYSHPWFGLTSTLAVHVFCVSSFVIAGIYCLLRHKYHQLFKSS